MTKNLKELNVSDLAGVRSNSSAMFEKDDEERDYRLHSSREAYINSNKNTTKKDNKGLQIT